MSIFATYYIVRFQCSNCLHFLNQSIHVINLSLSCRNNYIDSSLMRTSLQFLLLEITSKWKRLWLTSNKWLERDRCRMPLWQKSTIKSRHGNWFLWLPTSYPTTFSSLQQICHSKFRALVHQIINSAWKVVVRYNGMESDWFCAGT